MAKRSHRLVRRATLAGTARVAAALGLASRTAAHDAALALDVKPASARVSTGSVSGPIGGSLRAEVCGRLPEKATRRKARTTMD